MKQLVIGIFAHVDAGKTTLCEQLLFEGGSIRKKGRVDDRDSFLDSYALERERGITIFSKTARFNIGDTRITLIDTPGHIDFFAETERAASVIDVAILVHDASGEITAHEESVMNLLSENNIPTFIFANKTDMKRKEPSEVLSELAGYFSEEFVRFDSQRDGAFYERVAAVDEDAMEEFFETGEVSEATIEGLINQRQVLPVYFGSALKGENVKTFISDVEKYAKPRPMLSDNAFFVYKIASDDKGERLCFLRVLGGQISVKDEILGEKVDEIRLYSGDKYESAKCACAGEICAVKGPKNLYAGMGIGTSGEQFVKAQPVLSYRVIFPEGTNTVKAFEDLCRIGEEEPKYGIVSDEASKDIRVSVMGPIQLDVFRAIVKERTGISVEFDAGKIVYKESIVGGPYLGVGHFEPLRHYAEVHLLMYEGENGSGITFESDCSEDVLAGNWQRLIEKHVFERKHRGVLTGAELTDVHFVLTSGKAHEKHTEGGDFRQATYRAVRQGLMNAESVLLEPFYNFTIKVPERFVGHVMTDISEMSGSLETPVIENGIAVIKGKAPSVCLREYPIKLTAFSEGSGKIFFEYGGYFRCHNEEEVLAENTYIPTEDIRNSPDSVFCSQGSGHVVPWDEVYDVMHLPNELSKRTTDEMRILKPVYFSPEDIEAIGTQEVDEIISRSQSANRKGSVKRRFKYEHRDNIYIAGKSGLKPAQAKPQIILVDGYNVIFASEILSDLARDNLDGARGRLADMLCDYQGYRGVPVILVFDAYKVAGHDETSFSYHNITIVYTKEKQTADAYIERYAHENSRNCDILVVTSDGLEQVIIRGEGCRLMSSRELLSEMKNYMN